MLFRYSLMLIALGSFHFVGCGSPEPTLSADGDELSAFLETHPELDLEDPDYIPPSE